jgi:hypothetical protein
MSEETKCMLRREARFLSVGLTLWGTALLMWGLI